VGQPDRPSTVQVDLVDLEIAVPNALEEEAAAVGRPHRVLVARLKRGDRPVSAPVGVHHPDHALHPAVGPEFPEVGDLRPVRGPGGKDLELRSVREPDLSASVRGHGVDLVIAVSVGHEDDHRAVGGQERPLVAGLVVRQTAGLGPIGVHGPDLGTLVEVPDEEDPLSVGGVLGMFLRLR